MNIFILDEDPARAARDLCDKHVVKMIVESAQILSTVYRQAMEQRWGLSAKDPALFPRLYKSTHQNHPVVNWVRESSHNTDWLWQHLLGIEKEYARRYQRLHKTQAVIRELNGTRWAIWEELGDWRMHTPFAQCVPERYRDQGDAVRAYRAFYRGEKARFAKWAHQAEPTWWGPRLAA